MGSLTLHCTTATREDRMKLHSKTDIHTNTTQYVDKAVGWAGIRVEVCGALVMANNKCRFL